METSVWQVVDREFEGIKETLRRLRPDMILQDLVEGESAGGQVADTGNRPFDQIRELVWTSRGLLCIPG